MEYSTRQGGRSANDVFINVDQDVKGRVSER
jgi:hypothetical protein